MVVKTELFGNTVQKISLFLMLWLMITPAFAEELMGKVIAIADGDTLTVLGGDNQQIKIRLAEIDTPESGQPYGSRARQALAALAFGKQARIVETDRDRYGRTVGRVYVGGMDVNAELVRQGAAWVYRQYAKDPALFALEDEARAAKRGLWALPEAQQIPPWEWRKAERQQPPAAPPAAPTSPGDGFTCGAKRYCREMTSCAEARFYLNSCGFSRLDGDRDGTPCESLCR